MAYLPRAWRANRHHVPGQTTWFAIHGRYLYALLVPLAIFFAVAGSGLVMRYFHRGVLTLAVVVIGVGCAVHVATGIQMLNDYWQGVNAPFSKHLSAMLAWSPLPSVLTIALLLLPFVAILLTVLLVARLFTSRAPTGGHGEGGLAIASGRRGPRWRCWPPPAPEGSRPTGEPSSSR